MNGAILQQVFVVEYVVQYQMCDDCHRVEAKDFWKAVVQVRQKVRCLCALRNLLVFTWNALKNCPAWQKPSGDSTERLKIRFTNAGIALRDLFKFLHGHWHAVLIWQTLHKKTFYYLEQLILKHKLHQNSLNIKEIHGRSNFILSPACRQCVSAEGGTGPLFLLGGPWSDPQWKVGPRLIRQQCN